MVIKPGDTIVYPIDQANGQDLSMIRKALVDECPDVNWVVVAGGRDAVIYRPKRRNRFRRKVEPQV
jgi:hypothetical protein